MFERTELLIGNDGLEKLRKSRVLVVGIGGVGAFAAEFVVRSGVGAITLVDGDMVSDSNLNRQLPALHSTVGRSKVAVMRDRLLDINPELEITVFDMFVDAGSIGGILDAGFDFVIDAIDTVRAKTALIMGALERHCGLVSSMGAAGKLDPSKIELAMLEKSHHCPLARAVRHSVREAGGDCRFPVVFSAEEPRGGVERFSDPSAGMRSAPGSISYLPAAFGGFCAAAAIRYLLENNAPELEKR
ncbi:MAG: tRNA threonylcarbamoyladenosine dehydratase [Victivallaceae bacterium]|nr:tRNA threonylcarbamoyladenosine dehydratase [Victivallaceae bacterium]